MEKFSQGYKHYGLNRGEHEGKTGTWYREWAPAAKVRRGAADPSYRQPAFTSVLTTLSSVQIPIRAL